MRPRAGPRRQRGATLPVDGDAMLVAPIAIVGSGDTLVSRTSDTFRCEIGACGH
jgi:hypothetical protein